MYQRQSGRGLWETHHRNKALDKRSGACYKWGSERQLENLRMTTLATRYEGGFREARAATFSRVFRSSAGLHFSGDNMSEKTPYWKQLRDPRWQKKRLEIMERAGFACEKCQTESDTLNVHHGCYESGKSPWEYDNNTMWCLCESCHLEVTKYIREIRSHLGRVSPTVLDELLGYIDGLIMHDNQNEKFSIPSAPYADGLERSFCDYQKGIDVVRLSDFGKKRVSAKMIEDYKKSTKKAKQHVCK